LLRWIKSEIIAINKDMTTLNKDHYSQLVSAGQWLNRCGQRCLTHGDLALPSKDLLWHTDLGESIHLIKPLRTTLVWHQESISHRGNCWG